MLRNKPYPELNLLINIVASLEKVLILLQSVRLRLVNITH